MTLLCELADKYGSDKHATHGYTPLYYDLLNNKPVMSLLEIGIYKGSSLLMWRDFFPDARIYGIDCKPPFLHDAERITSLLANQNDAVALREIGETYGPFDIIIDDAAHWPEYQMAAMGALLPHLADRGLYFIEDCWNLPSVSSAIPDGADWYAVKSRNTNASHGQEYLIVIRP